MKGAAKSSITIRLRANSLPLKMLDGQPQESREPPAGAAVAGSAGKTVLQPLRLAICSLICWASADSGSSCRALSQSESASEYLLVRQ